MAQGLSVVRRLAPAFAAAGTARMPGQLDAVAAEHHLGGVGQRLWRVGPAHAGSQEGFGARSGAVPDRDLVTQGLQPNRHGGPHLSRTCDANVHDVSTPDRVA
jgi:hypothetical protein